MEEYGTAGQATGGKIIRRFACWIIRATNLHSEYATLIPFPWQQLFIDCASMLRHAYIASPDLFSFLSILALVTFPLIFVVENYYNVCENLHNRLKSMSIKLTMWFHCDMGVAKAGEFNILLKEVSK